MKKRLTLKSIIIRLILLFVMIVMVAISILGVMQRTGIELTQLAPTTASQSMGYVIKNCKGKVIVIDGGVEGDSANLLRYINEYGGKVDAWYITHPHIDHMGAFCDIISNNIEFPVSKIYVALNDEEWYEKYTDDGTINEVKKFFDVIDNEKIKSKVEQVYIGQTMDFENLHIEVLSGRNEEITSNSVNNTSMILKMTINDKSLLFLGDAGIEEGQKVISNLSTGKIKSTYVQMAHHGQSGVSLDFYEKVNPEYCLWPTPLWLWNNDSGSGENSGNWKTKETISYIENLNVKKNFVAKDGNKTIKIW